MSALKKITDAAKKIRKAHPATSWRSAIKQAGVKYRTGKLGASVGKRHKTATHKKTARVVRPGQTVRVKHVIAGTVSHHVSKAKELLKEQIGWAEASKFTAKTKRSKREIAKKIAALKHQYNRLK